MSAQNSSSLTTLLLLFASLWRAFLKIAIRLALISHCQSAWPVSSENHLYVERSSESRQVPARSLAGFKRRRQHASLCTFDSRHAMRVIVGCGRVVHDGVVMRT